MKKSALVLFALCLCFNPAVAGPLSVEQLLARSEKQAERKQFDEALKSLDKAAALESDNMEVKLARARIHSWQGHYDKAQREVEALRVKDPDNADIQTLDAYLDYYQGHNAAAETKFAGILAANPAYTDAADGLKLAQDAQQSAEGFAWQFDAGYERSSFARQGQPNWSNEFVQVTRSFDGGATTVHGRFEYYDEFQTTDSYYEIGADHRFTPYLNGYLYGGHTVDASFRPTWRAGTGGNLRLDAPEEFIPGIWLTLDAKEDEYSNVSIATLNPGVRLEAGDWALSPSLVMVHQWGLPSIFGWNARLDGPITDGWRFYAGYADAPETENAVTVYTATAYGGLSWDIDDAHTVRAGYTHDDRQNSYIRHVVDVSFSYRL